MVSRMTISGKQFVCHSLPFTKGKKTKTSIILSHFCNLNFLFGLIKIFIISNVLNSARSDSISLCELVSSEPPVLTYFQ